MKYLRVELFLTYFFCKNCKHKNIYEVKYRYTCWAQYCRKLALSQKPEAVSKHSALSKLMSTMSAAVKNGILCSMVRWNLFYALEITCRHSLRVKLLC